MGIFWGSEQTRYNVVDNGLSCYKLFTGYNGLGGQSVSLLKALGHPDPDQSETDNVVDFMKGMGYSIFELSDNGKTCYSLQFKEKGKSSDMYTNKVCVDSSGKFSVEGRSDNNNLTFYIDGNKVCVRHWYQKDGVNDNAIEKCLKDSESFDQDALLKIAVEACGNSTTCTTSGGQFEDDGYSTLILSTAVGSVKEQDSLDKYKAEFINNSASDAAIQAINYLSGNNLTVDSLKYSPSEKRMLYQAYLESYYNVEVGCGADEIDAAWTGRIRWFDKNSGSMKDCHYRIGDNVKHENDPVNGIKDDGFLGYNSIDDLQTLIDEIGKLPQDYSEDELKEMGEIAEGELEKEDDEENVCYANSGSLGWIICPIIEGISRVGTAAWEFVESNFLQIRSEELFGSNSGVKAVWDNFRDIANTAFIILLMVVIFSQLTGVGIDNYGIKKILPKLIIVAILVNLSYLLCELAVELSNILGYGLNEMFSNWAGEIPEITGLETTGSTVGSNLAVLALGAGGLALFGVLNPVGALTVGGVLLGVGLAVLGVVISIVFSILFLFLILLIRNAGVVILIAVAPVAIVCNLLPNTEKIYKKWFELLKALLVVYPICGAMIGAGKLAGNMLASIDSPGMAISGMIVSVLPFFLIPTLLKQSLKLMGNVGAMLTSAGQRGSRRLSSGVRGKITGSEGVKDWSQYQKAQSDKRRANRVMKQLSGRTDLSARQQDKLRKAQDVMLAHRKEEKENRQRAESGYYSAMSNKQDLAFETETNAMSRLNNPTVLAAERQAMVDEARMKEAKARVALMTKKTSGQGMEQLMMKWNTAFDSGNMDDLVALTTLINQKYGSSGASKMADSLYTKQGVANNANYQTSLGALQQAMSENSSLAGNLKTKAPDAFQMIGDGGMRFDRNTGNMVYEDMNYFTKNNQTATKVSDWANVSGSALQRGLDSGAIDNNQLNELLTSEDPTIKSGIRSEKGKREALEAASYNREHGSSLDNSMASTKYQEEQRTHRANEQAAQDVARQNAMQTTIKEAIKEALPASQNSNTPTIVPGNASNLDDALRRYNDSRAGTRNMNDRHIGK
ncbi:hypothetical protein IKF30_00385 [Candidatus Saccharibacteria bacterium]|nr:hypothetical protein [Candidatus Saccharibacteria bacterium]